MECQSNVIRLKRLISVESNDVVLTGYSGEIFGSRSTRPARQQRDDVFNAGMARD